MMKKRILSVVILAVMLISVFALVSCGKKDEEKTPCPVSECTGVLVSGESGILYCEKNLTQQRHKSSSNALFVPARHSRL